MLWRPCAKCTIGHSYARTTGCAVSPRLAPFLPANDFQWLSAAVPPHGQIASISVLRQAQQFWATSPRAIFAAAIARIHARCQFYMAINVNKLTWRLMWTVWKSSVSIAFSADVRLPSRDYCSAHMEGQLEPFGNIWRLYPMLSQWLATIRQATHSSLRRRQVI